jgi:cbb3-type cytochrome oxidase subunit 3
VANAMKLFKNRVGISTLIATIFFIVVFVSAITVFAFVMGKQDQLNQAETAVRLILINKEQEKINATINGTDAVFENIGNKAVQICYVSTRVGDTLNITRVDVLLPPHSSPYTTKLVGETGIITSLGNYFSVGTP